MATGFEQMEKGVKGLFGGVGEFKNIFASNEAINKINTQGAGDWLTGIPRAVSNYRSENSSTHGNLIDSIKYAHGNLNDKGEFSGYNIGAIAGSVLTAGVGYRALSGGGLYRDQNGETNIAGVPFV